MGTAACCWGVAAAERDTDKCHFICLQRIEGCSRDRGGHDLDHHPTLFSLLRLNQDAWNICLPVLHGGRIKIICQGFVNLDLWRTSGYIGSKLADICQQACKLATHKWRSWRNPPDTANVLSAAAFGLVADINSPCGIALPPERIWLIRQEGGRSQIQEDFRGIHSEGEREREPFSSSVLSQGTRDNIPS